MNSVFEHLIPHPEHGMVLIQPIALSALGTSESEVMKHRKAGTLMEGVHFVRIPVKGGFARRAFVERFFPVLANLPGLFPVGISIKKATKNVGSFFPTFL